MTHEDVMQMLAETEIPFAYDHFAEGESPDPPFICFLFPGFGELRCRQRSVHHGEACGSSGRSGYAG